MGFLRGFLAPFRGGAFVLRHRLWAYLFLPLMLDIALSVTAAVLALRYWRAEGWVADLLHTSPVLGWIVLVVLAGLGAVVIFLVVQPLLNAVFVDRLSERVEREVRGTVPVVPFFASTVRALVHGLLKLVLYALALVVGLALTAITGVGAVVGVALAGLFLAYDGFDYPLSRRNAGFGAKWGYLVRHPGQTIGYGLGATLLYLIPFAIFVAPPFAAVGATLVFLEGETGKETKPEATTEKTPASQSGNVAADTRNPA